MQSNKYRNIAIIFFVLGTIIIGTVFFFFLPEKDKSIVNSFTLFGTFLSLYGIAIAYLQILSLNKINSETKFAVEKSLLRINQILSVSELSKANKIIQEIQMFLNHKKSESALIRMKDLKGILIQVKYNEDLVEYTDNKIYNQNITDLASDINNLNDFITGKKTGINFSKLNSNLEGLATTLTDFESKLKFK